jgi:hypothetical protein
MNDNAHQRIPSIMLYIESRRQDDVQDMKLHIDAVANELVNELLQANEKGKEEMLIKIAEILKHRDMLMHHHRSLS